MYLQRFLHISVVIVVLRLVNSMDHDNGDCGWCFPVCHYELYLWQVTEMFLKVMANIVALSS